MTMEPLSASDPGEVAGYRPRGRLGVPDCGSEVLRRSTPPARSAS